MTPKTNLPAPLDETAPVPQTPPPEAARLIAVYLRTLTSPQTIKTYNTELSLFIAFLEGEMGKGLSELTAEDISVYREHLLGTYAAATVAKKLAVLRRFLVFTYMAGTTTVNPESLRFFAKSPRVRQDPAYNVLTEEELSRMLNARQGLQLPRLRDARREGQLRAQGSRGSKLADWRLPGGGGGTGTFARPRQGR